MFKYLKLYRMFVAQYLKRLMQSKVDFVMGVSGFIATQACGIVFLFLVFNQIPSLHGWSFYEILFIYGFAQLPRGIDHLLTDNIWLLAQRYVVEGTLDRYLLRPINPLFNLCADRFPPDGFGEIFVGIILVVYSMANLDLSVSFIFVVVFIIAVIFGSVIYTSIKLAFASLAFWSKDSMPMLYFAYSLSDFGKYPVSIYPAAIRAIVSYIVPFAFVAFYPATFFLGRKGFSESVLLEIVVAIVAWIVAYSIFKRGLKSYESAGN